MQAPDIPWLNTQVLWAAFFLSLAFGAIAQRTHFCTMGAVSDVVNMGDWTRMRQWGLAIGVAMIGFAALAYGGFIDPAKTLYSSTRWLWLSAAVGGAVFIKPGGGEMAGGEAVADKEDDGERFLDDPLAHVEPAAGGEDEEAKDGEELVAELHRAKGAA